MLNLFETNAIAMYIVSFEKVSISLARMGFGLNTLFL